MYKKIALLCEVVAWCLQVASQKITASFTSAASATNFSGKVFLYLSKDAKAPKDEMMGVDRFPCFAITNMLFQPGENSRFSYCNINLKFKIIHLNKK